MNYLLFYGSIVVSWIVFLICTRFRPLGPSHLFIGLFSCAFSFLYEIILGDRLKLYHYFTPQTSTFYIALSAVFLYPVFNMIYLLFLPQETRALVSYTFLWIVAMLFYEVVTVQTQIVVFTGWKPIPWSIVTYIGVYTLINLLYRYVSGKCIRPAGV